MSEQRLPQPRTYGGWRRRRSIGLLGLGVAGTMVLLGAAAVLTLTTAVSVTALLWVGPPMAAAAVMSLVRVHGMPLAAVALVGLRWWHATVRGWTSYRAGVVIAHPRAFQLPGVLAATSLVDAEDGYGGRYGLVWDRHTGYLTVTLRVTPTSTWLADRGDADSWVANWGGWLASLGYNPAVRWVSVTVDTAPEPGSTLADTVAAAVAPSAPEPARDIMALLVATAPAAAADVDTRVSVTFDPKASPAAPNSLLEAVSEVSRSVDGLASALGTCGVTVLGRATAGEIAGAVRTGFDPAARGEVNRLLSQAAQTAAAREVLAWADAGPVGAEETPGVYQHDGGLSVTWAWHEAPRQNVPADVLARLVAPGAYPKRVTLQFRPLPAAAATSLLEEEVNAARFREEFRRRTGRDETARDLSDRQRAAQAAAEEAQGAGVVLIALYVTVTVTDARHLDGAVAATEAAAESSKIRLRRMWHSQSAGFATTLPCGICPPEMSRRWAK